MVVEPVVPVGPLDDGSGALADVVESAAMIVEDDPEVGPVGPLGVEVVVVLLDELELPVGCVSAGTVVVDDVVLDDVVLEEDAVVDVVLVLLVDELEVTAACVSAGTVAGVEVTLGDAVEVTFGDVVD